MKLIKYLLIALLVVGFVAAGFYYAALHFSSDQLNGQSLANLPFVSNLANVKTLQPLLSMAMSEISKITPKSLPKSLPSVSMSQVAQLGQVLGAKDENGKNGGSGNGPLPAAAGSPQPQFFETARYTYCQQVVKDYEGRYAANSASMSAVIASPSASPAASPAFSN